MSEIDDVISRCRRGGGFAKRKTFTLARQKGIRKMREFALADPTYYILELIQAAVSNKANYINIEYNETNVLFSYVGGGIGREEMAHLFDFLFASKDKLEVAHLRELALGINALMLFEPDEVVLESGDGTMGGTSRMAMRGSNDVIDIGQSDAPVEGTYLLAQGLKRKVVRRKGLGEGDERMAIESRCLSAPVVIVVNHQAPFGFAAMRIPRLWGYHPTIEFDEGDLYGVLGLSAWAGPTSFRLLTHGVWIQSLERDLIAGAAIGGSVNFDRLRKTADHSAIVHDDVLEEMWLRLLPYAQRLVTHQTIPSLHDVSLLGGEKIPPKELRGWLRTVGRVIAVPTAIGASSRRGQMAREIGTIMQSPVVCVPDGQMRALRLIGGADVDVVVPSLGDKEELAFFQQLPMPPPEAPYLASPVEVAAVGVEEVALAVARRVAHQPTADGHRVERLAEEVQAILGGSGDLRAMLYAPEEPGNAANGLWVQVVACGRLVWEGEIATAHVGQWLVVQVFNTPPSRLRAPFPHNRLAGRCLAALIGEAMSDKSREQQRALHSLALENLVHRRNDLSEAGRTVALHALVRDSWVRLRPGKDGGKGPSVGLAWLDEEERIVDLGIFVTVDGQTRSPRQLVAEMQQSGGLVYGVIPEVEADLAGLDTSRILSLEEHSERMLVGLLGESAYVRVDCRDVLAEYGAVRCRDIAVGLRAYPRFPLLVEGDDPSGWSGEKRSRCLCALLTQLIDCFLGVRPQQPAAATRFPKWEENRRHACRHLQYFACQVMGGDVADDEGVFDLPLFLDGSGAVHTPRSVCAALSHSDGLRLVYRGGMGREELGKLTAAAATRERVATAIPKTLAVSPFVAQLVAPVGNTRVAFDFDITDSEAAQRIATPESAFIVVQRLQHPEFEGQIGVSALPVREPSLALLQKGHAARQVHSDVLCDGAVGFVRLVAGKWDDEVERTLEQELLRTTERLLEDLVVEVVDLRRQGDPKHVRAEEVLLDYAARHLVMAANPLGVVVPAVNKPTAQAIMALGLFPAGDGYAVSAWRLINEFCTFGVSAFPGGNRETALRQVLENAAPPHLQKWIGENLREGRVTRLSSQSVGRAMEMSDLEPGATPKAQLQRTLTYLMETLRPDDYRAVGARPYVDIRIGHDLFERETGGFYAEYRRVKQLNRLANPTNGSAMLARGEFAIFDIEGSIVYLNAHHWLIKRTLDKPNDRDCVAWLLLAAYAFINEVLEPVTNEHEQLFQLRVMEALESGLLCARV